MTRMMEAGSPADQPSGDLEAFDTRREDGLDASANPYKLHDIVTEKEFVEHPEHRMFPEGSDLFWQGIEPEEGNETTWQVVSWLEPIEQTD